MDKDEYDRVMGYFDDWRRKREELELAIKRLANQNADLRSQLFKQVPLTWNSDKPTKPGWYWYKRHGLGKKAIIVEVFKEANSIFIILYGERTYLYPTEILTQPSIYEGQWAGPIPEPHESATEFCPECGGKL